MSSAKRKREEQKQCCKRMKLGRRTPERRWDDVDIEEFKGSRQFDVVQQASSLQEDLENERMSELYEAVGKLIEEEERKEIVPEEGKRMERGEGKRMEPAEVHLGNLKDECPIRPVKDQPTRYKDIILFLHESRTRLRSLL
jgi:hypothetical protein